MPTIHRAIARKKMGSCEICSTSISRGTSYKWIAVKSYGTQNENRRIRCTDCDDWKTEDSSGLSARCLRLCYETKQFLLSSTVNPTTVRAIMYDLSQQIEYLANARRITADRARYALGPRNALTVNKIREAQALQAWSQRIAEWECPEIPDDGSSDEWLTKVRTNVLEILKQCPI